MTDAQSAPLLDELAGVKPWRTPSWIGGHFMAEYRYIMRHADLIHRAERDGIPQVAPILAAFGQPPREVRARIGKGLWRQVHHSDLMDNVFRAKAKLRTRLDFPTIMVIPRGALREVVGMCAASTSAAVAVAAHIATTRDEMREAVALARDTMRMNGTVNAAWSLRRLREEHDRLAREFARRRSDPTPFAEPWEVEVDGYRFRRLISAKDFALEGAEMHHCIAGYVAAAKRGDEVAFSVISDDERASVSFPRGTRMQIKGRYNRAVSARCRSAAEAMWRVFKAGRQQKERPSGRRGATTASEPGMRK